MKLYFLSPLFLQKLCWIPTRLILILCGHLEVRGLENLRSAGRNVVFAVNHTSELDPILIPASLPFFSRYSPIFYASRESKFYERSGWRRHFYGGLFFKIWGAYPVFVGLKDYEKSMPYQIVNIRDGGSLCVFPEGRTTPDGTIKEGKGGVAYLAERTGVAIIPVGITGVYRMSGGDFFWGRRHIRVSFGAPILQGELQANIARHADRAQNVYKEEAQYVMGKVRELVM